MKNEIMNKKGITLIELIISLSLSVIIISLVFYIFVFGNQTFRFGSAQNNIQNDLRYASEIIRDQIRYASDLSVINSFNPSSIVTNRSYFYLSSDKKSLLFKEANNTAKEIINFQSNDVVLELVFSKDLNIGNAVSFSKSIPGSVLDEKVLSFRISGSSLSTSKTYHVDSKVTLLNLGSQLSNMSYDGPVVVPAEGYITSGQQISFVTNGMSIYYTLDGSSPSIENGIKYTGPFNLYTTTTVKAIYVNSDGVSSIVAIYVFTVVEKPTASSIDISGNNTPGSTLGVIYSYTHPDGTTSQGVSIIRWYKYKNVGYTPTLLATQQYDPITGANYFTYSIKNSDKGDTIFVTVEPVHISGTKGDIAVSNNTIVVTK